MLIIFVFFNINYEKDFNEKIIRKKKTKGAENTPKPFGGGSATPICPPPFGRNEGGELPPWPIGVAVATPFFIFIFK
jgi:hypothetical protein